MRCALAGALRSSSFSATWFRERMTTFLPRRRLQLLTAKRTTRAFAGWPALAPHRTAVDKDVLDPSRRGRRSFERRAVGDGLGIEDRHVGIAAGPQSAAAGETKTIGGEAGHPAHRLFEAEEPELAAVIAENAWEGAPQPRVGMGVV